MHPGPMNRGMEIAADVADSRPLDDRRAGRQRRRASGWPCSTCCSAAPSPRCRARRRSRRGRQRVTGVPDPGRRTRSAATAPTCCSRDGVIADDRRGLDAGDADVVDADGLVALPGLVDLHTHLREPGREDAETVETGTRGRGPRRLHRRARDGQHRPGRRHRRRRRAGLAARPRGRPLRRAPGRRRHRRPRAASGSPSSARWPTRPRGCGSSPTTASASPTRC